MTPIDIEQLGGLIPRTMLRGRAALRSRLENARRASRGGGGGATHPGLARLAEAIERSVELREARLERFPRPRFPDDLPVSQRREEIAAAIDKHRVVVVCGATGSGKTTQIPKICLELGRGVQGMIGHTQPRRIAARSVAARLSRELQSPLGQAVGYKIRFTDRISDRTHIKLMTDGILLAETQHDRRLEAYDTLIIDEAHERSLNIDFLLGYLRRLLERRDDLKVIITSATIDPGSFSRFFNDAPIIQVSGRTYPVEVRYRPLAGEDEQEDLDQTQAIVAAVDELSRLGPGDVLVFLPGEREIRETAEALRGSSPAGTEILPLYSRLSGDEQMRVFQPHQRRRIVLATNVAETSLTVPGIRYVVDPGRARLSRYNPRNKVRRLPIEAISQASAEQRQGRCGREAPGVCIRLYSEADFAARPDYTEPEILRSNLASVILQMKAMELGDIERFAFLQPPEGRSIRDGYQTLLEIGAIDAGGDLTAMGRDLAHLPVDPRIGRMIVEGRRLGCLEEILIIAAALSVPDPRERPLEKAELADLAHQPFADERSDFMALLKLWDFFHEIRHKLSSSQLRKACRENFISYPRMREWMDVHLQLKSLMQETQAGHAGGR